MKTMDHLDDDSELDTLTKNLIRSATMPDIQPDFSDSVMRKIAPANEQSKFEYRLTGLLLLLTIIAVALSVTGTADIITRVLAPLAGAPWLLLLTSGSLLLIVKLFEAVTADPDKPQPGR
jgi:hypothetical protein